MISSAISTSAVVINRPHQYIHFISLLGVAPK
uniref:Uncharacterized protein n=1 Tax=Mycolicibacterium neoaurum VKM Ac-1815D TaxID=700508 RepID=V5XIX3_MYCNE